MSTDVNLEIKVVEGYRGKPSVYLEIEMLVSGAAAVSLESRGINDLADIKTFLEDIAAMIQAESSSGKPVPFNPQPTGVQ
jgi:hypothetical protein